MRIIKQSIITGVFPFFQHDVQWTSYASVPSSQQGLTYLYPGTGFSQRGSDQRPFLMGMTATLFIHQAISQVYRYRIIGVTFQSPWDFSGALVTKDFWPNDFTSTTLWDNPILQAQDQLLIRFNVWLNKIMTIDTTYGNSPMITQLSIQVPSTQMNFTWDDTDSTNTRSGAQVLFIVTDAPTGSASYFYDLSFDRKFKCIK